MSTPVDSSAVVDILEIVESIPAAGGYIIAMVGFSVFAWILAMWARSSQRSFAASQQSMQNMVNMSESLRSAMRRDIEMCHEECRRKDEINAQLIRDKEELIRQHSIARQTFLEAEQEMREMHMEALRECERLRERLAGMVETVSILTTKLDNANNLRRATDPDPGASPHDE